jgi:hypothetical protein
MAWRGSAATFLLGIKSKRRLVSAPAHPVVRIKPEASPRDYSPQDNSPQDKETSMELKMRLNLLAAFASFGFVAAIAFGMF